MKQITRSVPIHGTRRLVISAWNCVPVGLIAVSESRVPLEHSPGYRSEVRLTRSKAYFSLVEITPLKIKFDTGSQSCDAPPVV
jgi:hypothetical protein